MPRQATRAFEAEEIAGIRALRPIFALLTFYVVEMAGVACLVGAGDTRTGLWVLGSVAVLNMPLAFFFHQGLGPLPLSLLALGAAVGLESQDGRDGRAEDQDGGHRRH